MDNLILGILGNMYKLIKSSTKRGVPLKSIHLISFLLIL